MIKIIKKIKSGVSVSEMKDGDIGEIVSLNGIQSAYDKRIVQRYKNDLICLGAHSGESWTGVCSSSRSCIRVEILPAGTEFILE